MKRVTAFVGSARKKHTYDAARRLLSHLEAQGDVESEIVLLSDYRLEPCRGCKLCFEKGHEACPLKDDRDTLLAMMDASDGVVLASPSYMFQVSGMTKTLLDRLAFVGHRPRFQGKTFTSVVTQGLPFDAKIVQYLDFVGSCFGYKTVAGTRITALEPMTEKEVRHVDRRLERHSRRYRDTLFGPDNPSPSIKMLIGFRIGRATMKLELDEKSYDYRYYRDKGWLESAYFYPVRLGPAKRVLGRLGDAIGARMARARGKR